MHGSIPHAGSRLGLAALVFVAGILAYLPWAHLPLGLCEFNAGGYFGPFARSFSHFGFGELRGIPLPGHAAHLPEAAGEPYLNHPPGTAWLLAAFGSSEAALRAPTLVGHALAAVFLCLICARCFTRGVALVAGLTWLAVPAAALYSQVSYEAVVMPLGLGLWWATLAAATAEPRARPGWRVLQGTFALLGIWADWFFVFYATSLVLLVLRRSWRETIAGLWAPALGGALGLGLLVVWVQWALGAAFVPESLRALGWKALLVQNTAGVVDAATFCRESFRRLVEGYGLVLPLGALLGLVPLFRRAPRLGCALLVLGLQGPCLFPFHAHGHVIHWAALGPFCVAAVAALAHQGGRLGLALQVVVLLACAVVTGKQMASDRVPLQKQLGATMTQATQTGGAAQAAVFCSAPVYGYYLGSPAAYGVPIVTPAELEALRAQAPAGATVRYLWLRCGGTLQREWPTLGDSAPLAQYLEPFAKTRVPELEQTWWLAGRWRDLVVREAWLVTLSR